jgi:hypothetical protein
VKKSRHYSASLSVVRGASLAALGEGQKSESASGEARGRGGLGALMRAPISEAIIIVILGFLIGGIAAAIIHFAV